MTKLSDTQLLLLASAAKRDDRALVPPDHLKGGAREKVLDRLLALQLIERVDPAPDAPRPLGNDEPPVTLRITEAGLAAIGIDTEVGENCQRDRRGEMMAVAAGEPAETAGSLDAIAVEAHPLAEVAETSSPAAEPAGRPVEALASPDGIAATTESADRAAASVSRASPKLDLVLDLLRRPEGASLDELVAATGWQRHSVRGAIAGSVKRKLGHTVLSQKLDGVRTYRIEA